MANPLRISPTTIPDFEETHNLEIGDAVKGGTANSVLFIDASANVAQDPNDFNYDQTNNRLAVGEDVPLAKLHLRTNVVEPLLLLVKGTGLAEDVLRAQTQGGTRYATINNLGYIGNGPNPPSRPIDIQLGTISKSWSHKFSTIGTFESDQSSGNIVLVSPNTGHSRIDFADNDERDVGSIDYDHASDALMFKTKNVDNRLVITGQNRVGVNLTAPDSSLQVNTNGTDPTLILGANAAPSADHIRIQDQTAARLATFNNNGWLCIGSRAPERVLDVVQTEITKSWSHKYNTVASFESGLDSANFVLSAPNTGHSRIDFADNDSRDSGSLDYNHGTNQFEFRVNNTNNQVIFDASGNVIVQSDTLVTLGGAGSNDGIRKNSTSGNIEIVKNGAVVASW